MHLAQQDLVDDQGDTAYQSAFAMLGESWNISDSILDIIEKFVCEVYGQKECADSNLARYNCFRIGLYLDGSSLPPNKDSLHLHIRRANYQAGIYRRCSTQIINAPNPSSHGWEEKNCFSVLWSTLPPAPKNIMDVTKCNCKKSSCSLMICLWFKNNVRCSKKCCCSTNCNNK